MGRVGAPAVDLRIRSRRAGAPTEDRRIPWTRLDWWVVAALGLVALVTVILFTQAYPRFSPIDEFQHVDYAVKAGHFELVREGDQAGETALRAFACLGVDSDFPPIDCGAPDLEPYFFPDHGYNTAAQQTPLYYTVTGVAGRVVTAATPADVLTGLRLTGALWLTAALALAWLIGAELGVPRRQRAIAVALFAPAVQLLFTSSTVNADNGLMIGGGLVTVALLRTERGASRWWLVGASIVAVALEPTAALAVAAACLFLLVRAIATAERETRVRLAVLSGAIAVVGVATVLFLDLLRDAFIGGWVPPNLERYGELFTNDLSASQVVENLFAVVTPISNPYVPGFLDGGLTTALNTLTALAMVALLATAAVVDRARTRTGVLGGTLLATMVLAGPLFVLYLYVQSDVYFEIPSRYGLALVPAAIATCGAALRWPVARRAAVALAVVHALHLGIRLVTA
jgi:hypothetical protein